MSPTTLTLSMLLCVLCACGSPPSAKSPDGRQRTPINSSAAIAQYQSKSQVSNRATADTATSASAGTAGDRWSALQQELRTLRQRLDELEQRSRMQSPFDQGPMRTFIDGAEVEHHPGKLVIRIMHPVGQAAIRPGAALEALLLARAAASGRIEVRGRTDAWRPDALNQRLAEQRAALARQYLLSRGVAHQKINTTYLAAGDFVADNRTAFGRARNRRVEIELIAAAPALSDETAAKSRSTP